MSPFVFEKLTTKNVIYYSNLICNCMNRNVVSQTTKQKVGLMVFLNMFGFFSPPSSESYEVPVYVRENVPGSFSQPGERQTLFSKHFKNMFLLTYFW